VDQELIVRFGKGHRRFNNEIGPRGAPVIAFPARIGAAFEEPLVSPFPNTIVHFVFLSFQRFNGPYNHCRLSTHL
jgi:hypothetical protein